MTEAICKRVCEIAKETGAYIKSCRSEITSASVETKGLHDFVTYVDKEAEKRIVTGLKDLVPGAGFITEEKTIDLTGKEYNWIIDPLDGTTNFIHGVPVFCISIALMKHEQVVLGVIYEINLDEMFYAWENSNAYLNGKIITCSSVNQLEDSLLATGFPYHDYSRLDQYMELFRHLIQHSHGVRRPGSAAADLAYVAAGRFDGFYEYGLNAWDVAAGVFLVQRAGGKVSDFTGGGNYIFGKELISASSGLFNELQRTLASYMER